MNFFEITHYKLAISDLVADRKKSEKGISRKLAEYLNVHPTMISQVMTGTKDFTEEQMILVCEFFGLPKLETQYLLILLQIERAGSKKLKDHFQEQKEQIQKKALKVAERITKDRQLTDNETAIFYSSWLYPTIQLMTTLEKKPRFDDICKRLNQPNAKVREILDFLIQLQMVTEKDGIFLSGPVSTHLGKNSPHLVKHHTNWRLKAIQSAENLTDQELMYTACFSTNTKDFEIFREELMQLIQKFLKFMGPSKSEDLAQLNLDFFWIK